MTLNKLALTSVLLVALGGCASTATKTDDTMAAEASETKAETMMVEEKAAAEKSEKMVEAEVMAEKEAMVEEKEAMVEEKEAMVEEKEAVKEEKEEKKSSKKTLVKSFTASREDAHAAATAAMKQYGFKIKKSEDDYLEGKRSHKVGLAVGSGGEKLIIKLDDAGDGATEVSVRTKKTLVGYVGQKNWNDEVMEAISETLG